MEKVKLTPNPEFQALVEEKKSLLEAMKEIVSKQLKEEEDGQ